MKNTTLRSMILTALFAALTAIGAFLKITMPHVSVTLQVFFTCMAGLLLGPYWGAASQLVYVLLGLVGLPIFTEGGGLMYVAKPTFGFLLGLIPMAFVVGLMTRDLPYRRKKQRLPDGPQVQMQLLSRPKQLLRIALAELIGLAALYVIGLPYLYIALGGLWSLKKTIVSGCLIFLPFDAIKLICAAFLSVRLVPLLRKK